ncbi:hypothetical protein Adt_10203 [Abeliophyllum distichum]|uniref:Uncharacterized protein n=1 Tax=Abeliophyllum distichum TaxID=126358 RepID=A0ABD1UJB4_9LAMI
MHDRKSNSTSTRGPSFNACTTQGTQLLSRASPTGTRPPYSWLLTWNRASLKCLPHWDTATLQLAPPMEHSFAQGPLPLGLGHLAICSSHGAELRSSASLTGTRAPCGWLLLWNTNSLNGLFHWDSAALRLALSMEYSFAQGPLPLGLDKPQKTRPTVHINVCPRPCGT